MAANTDGTGVRPLRIAQVSTASVGGGAEQVARDLHAGYRKNGLTADLYTGWGGAVEPGIRRIDNDSARSTWARAWLGDVEARQPGLFRRSIAEPVRRLQRRAGREDMCFPATAATVDLLHGYDCVQLHNLHGEYFDLRELPRLAAGVPVVLTMHDAWLLSGHCAFSLACERWLTGCGNCPDLGLPPAVRRDATAANWRRKQRLLQRVPLRLAPSSESLADRVRRAPLAETAAEIRVVPNGVDLDLFRPRTDRLPGRRPVVLFSGNNPDANRYKDYATVAAAVQVAATEYGRPMTLIVLGATGETEINGLVEIRRVPFSADREVVARYMRDADVYLHAAHAETFGLTVIEALASGTPVVATAVGGIPEQVRPLPGPIGGIAELTQAGDATGYLVPPGDSHAMGRALAALLDRPDLLGQMSLAARRDAEQRFDQRDQVAAYVRWFDEIAAARPT